MRDGVYGTILPLAEWFVRSWPSLFDSRRAEPDPSATARSRYLWNRTHELRFCGDGTAVPNLKMHDADDMFVWLEWSADHERDNPFERVLFTRWGKGRIRRALLQTRIADFVTSVLEHLQAIAPEAQRTAALANDWQLVTDSQNQDHEAAVLSAQLGCLWWDMRPELRERIRRLPEELNLVSQGLLEITALDELDHNLAVASDVWRRVEGTGEAPDEWLQLREDLQALPPARNGTTPPWIVGWHQADNLRSLIGDTRVALERSDLGTGLPLGELDSAAANADSIVAWKGGHAPLRLHTTVAEKRWHRRFANARDLHPVLFASSPGDDYAQVFSPALSRGDSIANAFAAELVAPRRLLAERLAGTKEIGLGAVIDLAVELGAPWRCVLHQIENNQLATIRYH
jgi:hypothetical protein